MHKHKHKKDFTFLYSIAGVVLLGILGLGWLFMSKSGDVAHPSSTGSGSTTGEGLKITIISDKRCTTCGSTNEIISKVQQIPFLAKATYEGKDFSDAGIADYLKKNKIGLLPAFILSKKDVGDARFQEMLMEIDGGEFAVRPELSGATFNPFLERSTRGYALISEELLNSIKSNSYVKGDSQAGISWLEYSDLQCPFCAKLHNSGAIEAVNEKFGKNVNTIFNHYPLPFHQNAFPAATIAECVAKQKGSEGFYSFIHTSFSAATILSDGNVDTSTSSSDKFLLNEAKKLGVNESQLSECIKSNEIKSKIEAQAAMGAKEFGVTGTPANILINNKTREYEIIVGAQPKEVFLESIEKLMQ